MDTLALEMIKEFQVNPRGFSYTGVDLNPLSSFAPGAPEALKVLQGLTSHFDVPPEIASLLPASDRQDLSERGSLLLASLVHFTSKQDFKHLIFTLLSQVMSLWTEVQQLRNCVGIQTMNNGKMADEIKNLRKGLSNNFTPEKEIMMKEVKKVIAESLNASVDVKIQVLRNEFLGVENSLNKKGQRPNDNEASKTLSGSTVLSEPSILPLDQPSEKYPEKNNYFSKENNNFSNNYFSNLNNNSDNRITMEQISAKQEVYKTQFQAKKVLSTRKKPCWNCQGQCLDPQKCISPTRCGKCDAEHLTSLCQDLAKMKLVCSYCSSESHAIRDCNKFKNGLLYCQLCEKYGLHSAFDQSNNIVTCPQFKGLTRKQREGPLVKVDLETPVLASTNRGSYRGRGRGGRGKGRGRGTYRGGRGGAKG
jgi:hypothetical protein